MSKTTSKTISTSASIAPIDCYIAPQRNQQASSGAHCPPVRTNAIPLNTFVDPGSLRSHSQWDWQTGTMTRVPEDVLANARHSINRTRFKTVTSARTHPDLHPDFGTGALAAPSGIVRSGRSRDAGTLTSSPTVSTARKSRSVKKGR